MLKDPKDEFEENDSEEEEDGSGDGTLNVGAIEGFDGEDDRPPRRSWSVCCVGLARGSLGRGAGVLAGVAGAGPKPVPEEKPEADGEETYSAKSKSSNGAA